MVRKMYGMLLYSNKRQVKVVDLACSEDENEMFKDESYRDERYVDVVCAKCGAKTKSPVYVYCYKCDREYLPL